MWTVTHNERLTHGRFVQFAFCEQVQFLPSLTTFPWDSSPMDNPAVGGGPRRRQQHLIFKDL